jgi:microcystin-dependent protein
MLVPYNFAPRGFAFCQGQLMPISQNTALFSLLGTYYGGNGQTTFALPDLRGRIPNAFGSGPGLSNYDLGETGGEETVTLLYTEMPVHFHHIQGSGLPNSSQAANNVPARAAVYLKPPAFDVMLDQGAFSPNGGNQPHDNLMPTLTLNWIIALTGIFPARG